MFESKAALLVFVCVSCGITSAACNPRPLLPPRPALLALKVARSRPHLSFALPKGVAGRGQ